MPAILIPADDPQLTPVSLSVNGKRHELPFNTIIHHLTDEEIAALRDSNVVFTELPEIDASTSHAAPASAAGTEPGGAIPAAPDAAPPYPPAASEPFGLVPFVHEPAPASKPASPKARKPRRSSKA